MIRLNSYSAFAKYLAKKGSIVAKPKASHSEKIGVDTVQSSDRSETVEQIISALHCLDFFEPDVAFHLENALAGLLKMAGHNRVSSPTYSRLNDAERDRLLAAIFRGLSDTIISLQGRIPAHHLIAGMQSAAAIATELHEGVSDIDNHRDCQTCMKVLISYCQIIQYEDNLASRKRQRAAKKAAVSVAQTTGIFE